MTVLPSYAADTNSFDLNILKERGIDTQLAEYFREAARFRPGVQVVTLFVNGNKRGRVDARFNQKGELCFDKDVLDKGGLLVPNKLGNTEKSTTTPPLVGKMGSAIDKPVPTFQNNSFFI